MACIYPERLDSKTQQKIMNLSIGYSNPKGLLLFLLICFFLLLSYNN